MQQPNIQNKLAEIARAPDKAFIEIYLFILYVGV
jgi:hypothetical protein